MSDPAQVRAFLDAVDTAWGLASAPQVRQAWAEESSCAGMTVGGLTHHLLNQAGNTARGLRAAPGDLEPVSIADHYARAAWVRALPDDEVNTGIRDADNTRAEAGPDSVLSEAGALIDALPALLAAAR